MVSTDLLYGRVTVVWSVVVVDVCVGGSFCTTVVQLEKRMAVRTLVELIMIVFMMLMVVLAGGFGPNTPECRHH